MTTISKGLLIMQNDFINRQWAYPTTAFNQIAQTEKNFYSFNPMIEHLTRLEAITHPVIPTLRLETIMPYSIIDRMYKIPQITIPYRYAVDNLNHLTNVTKFFSYHSFSIYSQTINQLTSHFSTYDAPLKFINKISFDFLETATQKHFDIFNKTARILNHQQKFYYTNYLFNYENIAFYHRVLTDISPDTLETYEDISPILQLIRNLSKKDKITILKAFSRKVYFRIDSLTKTVQRKINAMLSIDKATKYSESILKVLTGINLVYDTQSEPIQQLLSIFVRYLLVTLIFLQVYICSHDDN